MKILLVEDDTFVSTALEKMLAAHHYITDLATDGQTGLNLVTVGEYDLIVLDLQIPILDGISLCRKLRSQGYTKPILLLTAKGSDTDIVAGLDAGADDYVIKPYAPEALLARIRALLRRSGAIVSSDVQVSSHLTWGNLCLDLNSGRVTFGEQVIPLTATEYNLLELFLRNPDRIFNRSAILDRLWGFEDAPTERAINTHIKEVRKKLKAGGLTEEIIETIYGMGYRLKPCPKNSAVSQEAETEKKHKVMTSINKVIEQFRDILQEQLAVITAAKTAFLTGNLDEKLYQSAKYEAHKLAGSLGSFGYPEGSRLARTIEHLLQKKFPLSSEDMARFVQLVTALQKELSKSPIPLDLTTEAVPKKHRVLAIDNDAILMEQLLAEADAWAIEIKVALNLSTARSQITLTPPDLVLLDLSFSDTEEHGLMLLQELVEKSPQIPVIVFTDKNSLSDRLTVSRLGARQFLHKPATTEQIFQAINRVFQTVTTEAKVLIVDDDPLVLTNLKALLTPWGLEVFTLAEPEKFWEVLIATNPNLVVLDVEMPLVSGLELCQVIRQDSQWGDLPILVVTAHIDAESLQQAFAAGADDFITKPVLGPELVTRILSRIERNRYRFLSKNR
ncbi:response regulator [Phormidium sp. LEGE 05292]|uniref:response regulator n=1 Tax=[Phormidium] sp. LEGE 05292 TaxID=767427 RepID=UPI00187E161F|nr:response regulator [Phormidium sp. LEGE 05292]MBE9226051.1 response regulator [Phormidium sp. LEGE 05292]